jgi:mRNA interferase MazF
MLPDAGDIAWVELDPVRGTEQAGRRPGLVLTPRAYHELSRRAIVCPISASAGAWPLNVALPVGLKTEGAVLLDQIRTIDRTQRMFAIIERVPREVLIEVRGKLAALLGIGGVPRHAGRHGT